MFGIMWGLLETKQKLRLPIIDYYNTSNNVWQKKIIRNKNSIEYFNYKKKTTLC